LERFPENITSYLLVYVALTSRDCSVGIGTGYGGWTDDRVSIPGGGAANLSLQFCVFNVCVTSVSTNM
jgi:hypothetical protein